MDKPSNLPYTPHGFWHHTVYQQCPRRGYISNVLRIAPRFTPPALCKGSMVHAGVAGFRKGGPEAGLTAFQTTAEAAAHEFESEEKYVEVVNSAEQMLKDYFREYARDNEKYEWLAIEEDLHPVVHGPNGETFEMSLKTDAVGRDKETKVVYVFEVKTSGSLTPERQYAKLFNQDQPTAYLWAWNQLHPEAQAHDCIPDMLYHNKSVLYCRRPGKIYRSDHDLAEYEMGMYGQIKRTQALLADLELGVPPISLFPRRGDCDGDGFYTCDFRSICRSHLVPGDPPLGFKLKERRD